MLWYVLYMETVFPLISIFSKLLKWEINCNMFKGSLFSNEIIYQLIFIELPTRPLQFYQFPPSLGQQLLISFIWRSNMKNNVTLLSFEKEKSGWTLDSFNSDNEMFRVVFASNKVLSYITHEVLCSDKLKFTYKNNEAWVPCWIVLVKYFVLGAKIMNNIISCNWNRFENGKFSIYSGGSYRS